MITVAAFVLTLAVLIVIHEYGHYRVAIACGVKVLRFSVGFGRVIWRHQASPQSTEFVISALPLGGYVRMLDEREGPVVPGELDRAFNRKTLWQRSAIVAAGPLANLLLAVLLYACAHWIGMDEPKAVMGPPVAGSVAEHAGLRSGDWAQAWSEDGTQWDDLRSMNDLRWQVVQAALHRQPVQLQATGQGGYHLYRLYTADGGVSQNPKTTRAPDWVLAYFTAQPVTMIATQPAGRSPRMSRARTSVDETAGMDPGTRPPTSAWCPRFATKRRRVPAESNTVDTTVTSGRCEPPSKGSLLIRKSPSWSVSTGWRFRQARRVSPMGPSCMGISSACATVLP